MQIYLFNERVLIFFGELSIHGFIMYFFFAKDCLSFVVAHIFEQQLCPLCYESEKCLVWRENCSVQRRSDTDRYSCSNKRVIAKRENEAGMRHTPVWLFAVRNSGENTLLRAFHISRSEAEIRICVHNTVLQNMAVVVEMPTTILKGQLVRSQIYDWFLPCT